jgi:hypothetical protein
VIGKRVKLVKNLKSGNHEVLSQPHRAAKRHPLDCGNPKCLLCHSEKIFKKPLIRDIRRLPAFKDDLGEE